MTLAQALSGYVNSNLLIAVGFIGLAGLSWILRKINRPLRCKAELELHYLALVLLLALTVVHPLLPSHRLFEPTFKVWSAQSIRTFSMDYTRPDKSGFLSLPNLVGKSSLDADHVTLVRLATLAMLLIAGGLLMIRDLRHLFKIRQRSYLIRSSGRVRIYANDEILVPFSYWLPAQANIVVPAALIGQTDFYKMAVAHELQHHRQGNTR